MNKTSNYRFILFLLFTTIMLILIAVFLLSEGLLLKMLKSTTAIWAFGSGFLLFKEVFGSADIEVDSVSFTIRYAFRTRSLNISSSMLERINIVRKSFYISTNKGNFSVKYTKRNFETLKKLLVFSSNPCVSISKFAEDVKRSFFAPT